MNLITPPTSFVCIQALKVTLSRGMVIVPLLWSLSLFYLWSRSRSDNFIIYQMSQFLPCHHYLVSLVCTAGLQYSYLYSALYTVRCTLYNTLYSAQWTGFEVLHMTSVTIQCSAVHTFNNTIWTFICFFFGRLDSTEIFSALHCTELYCTGLNQIVLHCTVLQYTHLTELNWSIACGWVFSRFGWMYDIISVKLTVNCTEHCTI